MGRMICNQGNRNGTLSDRLSLRSTDFSEGENVVLPYERAIFGRRSRGPRMTWTEGIVLARVNPRWGYQGCNWLVTRRGHDGARTKEIQSNAIHNRMPSLGDSDRVYTRSAEPVPG